jgi:mevalonate pyrophosphate decarboxylase
MTAAIRAYARAAAASSERSVNSGIDRWNVMESKGSSTCSAALAARADENTQLPN